MKRKVSVQFPGPLNTTLKVQKCEIGGEIPLWKRLLKELFDESLKVRDVVGLWSHDTSQVLGNTKSNTLRIENDKKELRFELDIPNTTVGNDAWELIKRGDVDGVSFGMKVIKDKWSSEERENGKLYKRSILNAELYEISPVAFPAYPANEVNVRSLDDFKANEKRVANEYRKRKLALELELL